VSGAAGTDDDDVAGFAHDEIAVRLPDSDFDALLAAAAKNQPLPQGARGTQGSSSSFLLFSWTGGWLGRFFLWRRLRSCSRDLGQLGGHGTLDAEQAAVVGQHFGGAVE
jgi:hypothetical protein